MLLACAPGCATATIASAGAMAGLAATAVATGSDVYRMGKLDAAEMTSVAEWIAAARAAADELRLAPKKQSGDQTRRWHCTLIDDRGSKIKITVERRTETMCRARIDVGLFGSEPTARLLLARIRFHLGLMDAAAPPATLPADASGLRR
jgi:hypothetical protein